MTWVGKAPSELTWVKLPEASRGQTSWQRAKKWDPSASPAITKRHAAGQRALRVTTGCFDLGVWMEVGAVYLYYVLFWWGVMQRGLRQDFKPHFRETCWFLLKYDQSVILKGKRRLFLSWRDVLMWHQSMEAGLRYSWKTQVGSYVTVV